MSLAGRYGGSIGVIPTCIADNWRDNGSSVVIDRLKVRYDSIDIGRRSPDGS
jgi:hypothetical protein